MRADAHCAMIVTNVLKVVGETTEAEDACGSTSRAQSIATACHRCLDVAPGEIESEPLSHLLAVSHSAATLDPRRSPKTSPNHTAAGAVKPHQKLMLLQEEARRARVHADDAEAEQAHAGAARAYRARRAELVEEADQEGAAIVDGRRERLDVGELRPQGGDVLAVGFQLGEGALVIGDELLDVGSAASDESLHRSLCRLFCSDYLGVNDGLKKLVFCIRKLPYRTRRTYHAITSQRIPHSLLGRRIQKARCISF